MTRTLAFTLSTLVYLAATASLATAGDSTAPGGSGTHVCTCKKWGYCKATGPIPRPEPVPCCLEKQCH